LRDLSEPADGPIATPGRLRRDQRHLVAGFAERDGERLYNSSLLVRPDGTTALYRKVHLFWDEKLVFDAGDLGFPVFAACGTTVGMMICFDWFFPEAARTLARRGAKLIAHPSNLVLPAARRCDRCLENRCFAVTANRVGREERIEGRRLDFIGRSQVCGPRGATLARLGGDAVGAAVAHLDLADADPRLTPRNDLWEDRRPDQYADG
jgi:predicted amidohydrolase